MFMSALRDAEKLSLVCSRSVGQCVRAVVQDRHVGVADVWLCCVGTLCMDRILELINTGS